MKKLTRKKKIQNKKSISIDPSIENSDSSPFGGRWIPWLRIDKVMLSTITILIF